MEPRGSVTDKVERRISTMASNNEKSPRRREFLKLMGAGGAAAGAVVAAATAKKVDAAEAAPDAKGYHETAHVQSYYKSAKF